MKKIKIYCTLVIHTNHIASNLKSVNLTAILKTLFICDESQSVVYYLFRYRSEHNFIPVDNVLYQADGQMMTIYSHKE